MRRDKVITQLPDNYFEGKDGTNYRFTILKDIAVAGDAKPIPYDDAAHREQILGMYDKYKDFTIYVHFPWCVEHCSYCHYYRGPVLKRNEMEDMLAAERKYAEMLDDKIGLNKKNINSVYFGGGTPTVLPTDLMEGALDYWVGKYKTHDECEVCVETSVLTLVPKKVDILERYVDRLSIGIQSFDDKILEIMERKHRSAKAEKTLKEVVPRFPSVNVDLIYGLYEQDLDTWLKSVEVAADARAQSLTVYRLDIREIPAIIRRFREEPGKFPNERMCRRMYEEAKQLLESKGYRENLVGWFLLPSVKDTVVYRERWEKQSPCIAFGPGLHNYAHDHFYETLPAHEDYIRAVNEGKLPIKHMYDLTPKKQLIWYVMAQLKSNSPLYMSVMQNRFGQDITGWFMELIADYLQWGVLFKADDKIELAEDNNYILEWLLVGLIGEL